MTDEPVSLDLIDLNHALKDDYGIRIHELKKSKDGGLSYPQPLELKNSDAIDVTITVSKLSWLRGSYGVNACRNLYRIIHKFVQSTDSPDFFQTTNRSSSSG